MSKLNKNIDTSKLGPYVAVVLLIIFSVLFINSINNEPENSKNSNVKTADPVQSAPEATFEANISNYFAENPAALSFTANVINTSEVSGEFNCYVKATDSSSTYKGSDIFSGDAPLAPQESKIFNGTLTITKEGASWIDDVTIDCQY